MPIYEYRCKTCEEASELLIRDLSQPPLCPHCGSLDLEKLISVPGAVLTRGGSSEPACGQGHCPAVRPECGRSGGCCGGHH